MVNFRNTSQTIAAADNWSPTLFWGRWEIYCSLLPPPKDFRGNINRHAVITYYYWRLLNSKGHSLTDRRKLKCKWEMLIGGGGGKMTLADSITAETRLLLISIVIKDNPKMAIDTAHSFHILVSRCFGEFNSRNGKITQYYCDHKFMHFWGTESYSTRKFHSQKVFLLVTDGFI